MGFGLLAVFIAMVIICLINVWKTFTEPEVMPYGKPSIVTTILAWITGIAGIVLYILDREYVFGVSCGGPGTLIAGLFLCFAALAATVGLIKNR